MTFTVVGQKVTVVGAARSGIAAALLLAERGARVTLADVRPALDDAAAEARLRRSHVSLELGDHREQTFTSADLIVLSPGVAPQEPHVAAARSAGIPVVGEVELASRWLSGRIVAITGTKGKSTTTTLAGRMFSAGGLKTLVGGNIGTPLSSQVSDSTPETFHIVEVSSFQLEATDTFRPWIAVLLNFSPDHLDRHASVVEYGVAKARIFANQSESDWAVINADDPQTLALARATRARTVRFSSSGAVQDGFVVHDGAIRQVGQHHDRSLIPLSSIRLIGRHLVEDVLAAAAVAAIAGVSPDAMVRAVESFTGLEHALEPVDAVEGVQFVNDSKATNVDAARRAIESFEAGLVVIMGGRFKGGDFRTLGDSLRARKAAVVAIGESTDLIRRAFAGVVPVHAADGLASAVRRAFELAQGTGTVLLAPACSSFDMFRDYAERGRLFKAEVRKLAEELRARREQ
jgi:UDP-N-acetylmuramoylalanine--D-glutamate ligase